MITADALYRFPNALAPYYSRFRAGDRLLLTGHSHQAWPDCGFEAQMQAWLDAAEHLGDKWERAFEKAERVRRGYAGLLDGSNGSIALGASVHDLLVRFLSALPFRGRCRIVTTDGEFHSLRRQFDRLAEEGIAVVRVPSEPAAEVAGRLIAAVDPDTAAVLVSSVFYRTGHIVHGLGEVMAACRKYGAELLIDVYHSLNVAPFSLKREGLEDAFVIGGGYKYCQFGEGNAFLRFPSFCTMRPVVTGWFSEYETLHKPPGSGRVAYGEGPARFAGSTYEPASHYRAAEVFAFFERMGLHPALLRGVSQHQVGLLARSFDAMDLDPRIVTRDRTVALDAIGGFLVLHTPHAETFCRKLSDRGVFTDYRGNALRLGPAPYMSDSRIGEAMGILGEVGRKIV